MAADHRLGGARRWSVLVGFEPRDLWIGVYWDRRYPGGFEADVLDIYICVIPTLVLRLNRSLIVPDLTDRQRRRIERKMREERYAG